MKRILKVLGGIVLAVILVAIGGVTWLYARKPAMARPANLVIDPTPARLARGKYLFNLADCEGCHSERNFSNFGGPVIPGRHGVGVVFPREMGLPGLVAPPNITPDRETGLGTWTDGEKIRAIREGVDRDGRTLFPMMPYERFRRMSDEDVYSLVAYLNSLPPVRHLVPKTKIDFPVSLLIKSAPQPAGHVAAPDVSTPAKRGAYLVQLAGCQECHTPTLGGGQRFAFGPAAVVVSANISPDPSTGTGRWSAEYFVKRFADYRDYVQNGPPPAGPSSFTVMPWLNFAQLPDEDLRAIYAFIRTQPAVNKAVETHPGFDPKPQLLTKR